jgi:hypothetical protein
MAKDAINESVNAEPSKRISLRLRDGKSLPVPHPISFG